jgi:hypothetical protein
MTFSIRKRNTSTKGQPMPLTTSPSRPWLVYLDRVNSGERNLIEGRFPTEAAARTFYYSLPPANNRHLRFVG